MEIFTFRVFLPPTLLLWAGRAEQKQSLRLANCGGAIHGSARGLQSRRQTAAAERTAEQTRGRRRHNVYNSLANVTFVSNSIKGTRSGHAKPRPTGAPAFLHLDTARLRRAPSAGLAANGERLRETRSEANKAANCAEQFADAGGGLHIAQANALRLNDETSATDNKTRYFVAVAPTASSFEGHFLLTPRELRTERSRRGEKRHKNARREPPALPTGRAGKFQVIILYRFIAKVSSTILQAHSGDDLRQEGAFCDREAQPPTRSAREYKQNFTAIIRM